MKLITTEQGLNMLANGSINSLRALQGKEPENFRPEVKLFCPWSGATWLLTELDPEDPDLAFGLCDLGQGFPELGSVRLSEIAELRGPGGLAIERDIHFQAHKSIQAYADDARRSQRITA
jgi:Protein of unknown function (DUF2958)